VTFLSDMLSNFILRFFPSRSIEVIAIFFVRRIFDFVVIAVQLTPEMSNAFLAFRKYRKFI